MDLRRALGIWLPPVLIGVVALIAWQAAQRSDFERVDTAVATDYALRTDTPLLSVRRMPQTLQAPVSDELLADDLQNAIDASTESSCLAVQIGQRLLTPSVAVNGGVVPASNQKLLTTFAALERLGPDFRYLTSVRSSAPPVAGTLDGDLYLVGGGDPFLATAEWIDQYEVLDGRSFTSLETLADQVVESGITEVTGSLLGDESLYDSEDYVEEWDPRLIRQKQSGPLSALTVNEGFEEWPTEFQESVRPRRATEDPPTYAVEVFAELLRERGVEIANTGVGTAPGSAVDVTGLESPPLSATVTHINSYSSNIGAELLLKHLGLSQAGQGTTTAGASVVFETLQQTGIPTEGTLVFDGSGLAESDRLSCQTLTALLAYAGPDSVLASSLSISGERGSLAQRFPDSTIDGKVRAKTGTLDGVSALAGFVDSDADDRSAIFAYIVNYEGTVSSQEIVGTQAELLDAIARYPEGPSLEALSPKPPVVP